MKARLFVFAALLVATSPASAWDILSKHKPTPVEQALIDEEIRLNNLCRDGSADEAEWMGACDKRDAILVKLESRGWLWGWDDYAGACSDWHKADEAVPFRCGDDMRLTEGMTAPIPGNPLDKLVQP